ncbi:hypothetical protein QF008_001525 [Pseudomonas protegens]|jgi:hypothetical protein|uniref:hypothetical protein n=1 Tax=Pseudomonas TaxID=286 RepID=UPI000F4A0EE0|nr:MULTISPECIES: hypothetical protein [Pseudomonas]MBP5096774.1 hypothetical protein [Pseudomonas protegens]MDT3419780.1 hypothetical protein [Pseudomonas protegens]MDT9645626.1 hypothetical protein [Pseudomonas sp. JV245A]QTU07973.1 hypothetical protein HUT25_20225 [Pseudomonas protegens]QTU14282.1 hypothetical protein HUT23_20915 [Pseudomonas protegens]
MGTKRYFREFGLALLTYIACVLLSSHWLADMNPGPGKIALALVPVVPMVAMALAVVRQLRRMDELARRIQLEALGLSFVCTALITFSYGFLETAGLPRLSMFYVWPVMGLVWALATVAGVRRYR